ncbi:probable fructose-2,6-bisphosphatase TIGAR A isoform X2 [Nerophis lumbriciformis]|uniref:probable fructose-2,6-bisphosphatase TIGAR A isoform X2 n=1 Tax=Nerophis lumbriciformis TaxID=546530 RepID=UPI002ADF9DCB|nr:probable fructose-2,6-bisphosphatase TIGAR A isoform X2 [Nerophis lumbriciformis]XP_061826203.1 probable fructose-2,6-bisphosphatase TIGAR A isoform X2 [Nerophis lumbriciformis]XP_061826204.1 probable fructose-2,6-bisphosphatase TIGAR A isoform X2 [Nerophis lumbriciformis]XP_061826205.1 probable fructose-2,6-bisphosphatase TIGAR A isoform X2 [Nerophis lumbriciformis]
MRRTCNFVNTLQEMKALTIGLTFVRHGETQFNKDGLLQGQAIDCPLSEVGLQQAADAGRYLKDVKFTNVFVSDMLRARQTAETIMKHNSSCLCLQLVCDPLLKEKSFGMAEGQCLQDVKEMAKTAGQSFLDFTPPQGETREQSGHAADKLDATATIHHHLPTSHIQYLMPSRSSGFCSFVKYGKRPHCSAVTSEKKIKEQLESPPREKTGPMLKL